MRVTPSCDPLNNFYISAASNIQFMPDIAYGGGNYMVIWTDGRAGGASYRIYAARVTPTGSVLDPSGILIGTPDTFYQYSSSIVYNGSNFFAVWGNIYAPQRVMGRFINTNGSISDTCRIASVAGYIYYTKVAFSGSNYLVAWNEYSGSAYNCKGQIVSPSGTLIGSQFTIATGVYPSCLGLCWDGTQYCFSYILMSGYQLWGRKYDLNGTPLGSAFLISPSSNSHYYSDIIPGANNCYLNVWSEYISSSYDIFGNLDINIVGTEEQNKNKVSIPEVDTRIISGPLHLPADAKTRIFDISGREIDALKMVPGVYYLEVNGNIRTRIIKVR